MTNEIRILVRTQNSAKAGMQAVEKDFDDFAKRTSETFSKTFAESFSRNFTTHLDEAVRRSEAGTVAAGDRIGNTIGQRITQRITERIRTVFNRDSDVVNRAGSGGLADRDRVSTSDRDRVSVSDRDREHVTVDVDVDKQSLFSKISSLGKGISERVSGFFGDGLKTGITSVFSGDILSTLIKGGLITLAGLGLAPAIGAAITSGVLLALGGGVITAGVVGALQNPRIQTAIEGIKTKIKGMFAEFSGNFLGPLEDFFAPGNGGGGGIIGVLDQVNSMIQSIGRSFGPIAKQLGDGIIGFLQNALPGILRAVDASAPIVKVLADELPGIGTAIGKFFDSIRDGAPGATVFFKDLLNFIEWLIPKIGILIEAFTNMYVWVRTIFLRLNVLAADWAYGIITAASAAFSWIPGLQPKLLNARKTIEKFRDGANHALHDIDDVDVEVRLHVFGLAAANAVLNTTRALSRLGYIGKAAGGAVGQAASGGTRSNRTWVGEQGPELVDLAPGSRVYTAGDSARMAGQGGGMGGGTWTVRAIVDTSRASSRELIDVLLRDLRLEITNVAGGDVQMALGN